MNFKTLTKTVIAGATLLISTSALANVNVRVATKVTTKLSTAAVNAGIYSSAKGALAAAITRQAEYRKGLVESMDKHGAWAVGPVKQLDVALDAIAAGKMIEGMTQEEALNGIAIILQAISKLSDVNTISGVTGQKLNMKNKKAYFDNVNVVGLNNAQEEAVLAGIVALIQGGNLASGLQGKEISLEATRNGLKALQTFIDDNNLGDVQAALAAFEQMAGQEQAVDRAKNVAVSCSGTSI